MFSQRLVGFFCHDWSKLMIDGLFNVAADLRRSTFIFSIKLLDRNYSVILLLLLEKVLDNQLRKNKIGVKGIRDEQSPLWGLRQ